MTKKFTKIEMFQELSVILARIENKVDKLQKDVDELKPKQTTNKTIMASTGCLACGKYDCPAAITNLPCPKSVPYALSSGSLSDSGTVQTWRPSGDTNL